MEIIDISVFIMAISFCILTLFLIKALISLTESLKQAQKTLNHLDGQLDEISVEAKQVLRNANEVLVDVKSKSQTLDPIFERIEDAGEAAKQLSASVIQMSSSVSGSVLGRFNKPPGSLPGAIRAVSLGYFLAKKWKKRKVKE